MAAAMGCTTFVESRRPPRPTSSTATSTRARRKSSKAIAVVTSKNVGGDSSDPSASRPSITRRTCSINSTSRLESTGTPSTANRSSRRTRCGDVYRPTFTPAARRAQSIMAVTDPLPFVPATRMLLKCVSGWPRAAASAWMFARPNLMPNFSSARRYSNGSTSTAPPQRPRPAAPLRRDAAP